MYIVLGVTGSISAYKAADIANRLHKDGHDVHVVMTDGAKEFITPLTLQTLSKNKVHANEFEEYDPTIVKHIDLAGNADVVLIAPATANVIGKINPDEHRSLVTSSNLITFSFFDLKKIIKSVCGSNSQCHFTNCNASSFTDSPISCITRFFT